MTEQGKWLDEADGVFRGGGVKGLGLVGALEGFAAHGTKPVRRWVNVAGASAGAIIASYLAVHPDDGVAKLKGLMSDAPFASFEDIPFGGPPVGAVANFMLHHGLARGDVFRDWFDGVLEQATFKQVRTPDGASWRLKLVAVDVTNHELLLLPDDLARYREPGSRTPIDPDGFKIAHAARMSMSIPFFFEPVPLVRDCVRCTDPGGTSLGTGDVLDRITFAAVNAEAVNAGLAGASFDELEHEQIALIVDGGTLSNFPVWIFDANPVDPAGPPQRMTFGFTLTGGRGIAPAAGVLAHMAPWPVRFGIDIFHTAQSAWDQRFAAHSTRVRTIAVDAGDVATTNFHLTDAQKAGLLSSGSDAATRFLDRFDPGTYVNTYGARPAQPGR
jgi:NTE family protein